MKIENFLCDESRSLDNIIDEIYDISQINLNYTDVLKDKAVDSILQWSNDRLKKIISKPFDLLAFILFFGDSPSRKDKIAKKFLSEREWFYSIIKTEEELNFVKNQILQEYKADIDNKFYILSKPEAHFHLSLLNFDKKTVIEKLKKKKISAEKIIQIPSEDDFLKNISNSLKKAPNKSKLYIDAHGYISVDALTTDNKENISSDAFVAAIEEGLKDNPNAVTELTITFLTCGSGASYGEEITKEDIEEGEEALIGGDITESFAFLTTQKLARKFPHIKFTSLARTESLRSEEGRQYTIPQLSWWAEEELGKYVPRYQDHSLFKNLKEEYKASGTKRAFVNNGNVYDHYSKELLYEDPKPKFLTNELHCIRALIVYIKARTNTWNLGFNYYKKTDFFSKIFGHPEPHGRDQIAAAKKLLAGLRAFVKGNEKISLSLTDAEIKALQAGFLKI